MILLIKSSLVIIFLLSFYKLFLERESFFKANRFYLIACLVLACALPFVVLPKMIDNQGYVDNLLAAEVSESSIELSEDSDSESNQNLMLNEDKLETEDTVDLIENMDENALSTSSEFENKKTLQPIIIKSKTTSRGWSFWIFCMYLFGVVILTLNLLGQVFNVVLKVMKNDDKIEDDGIVIVNMAGDVEPCSFFKYIFINPGNYDFDTYEQIIAHEKVHVKKGHSIDLLLSEIAVIILWFNPFVWLLRKEVEKNIEYQTDEALVTHESENKEIYQLNLVKIACNTSPLAITTNYNQSLIKQRILRMNAKRSNQFNYWKYAFCMPLIFVLLLILNRPLEGFSNHLDLPIDDIPEYIAENPEINIEPIKQEIKAEEDKVPSSPRKENTKKIKKDKPAQKAKFLESKFIADCEKFEKAVASGDIELVKQILKTLDPDCLKVKKKNGNNLTTVETMVKEKKKELNKKSVDSVNSEGSACDRLRIARDASNELEVKHILMNEDITCIQDIYGDPAQDLNLIKDILSYGAHLYIDDEGVISISNIGFYIDIEEPNAAGCDDPNYERLKVAISNKDKSAIREVIAGELLTCPLNEDGVTNDFIFMKKIMKFEPKIRIHSSSAITVRGIGFEIDIDKYIEKPDNFGVSYEEDPNNYYQQADILEDIQKRLNEIMENPEEASCLHLIDAVTVGDFELAKDFLKSISTECFHRETKTTSNDNGDSFTTSKVATPLKAAIRTRSVELVQLMLDQDADINYTGSGKETPLIAAVKTGNDKLVKLLVDNGADLNRKDEAYMTALDCARYFNFESIEKYLKSKGAKGD